jgi:endoplasmic reticulum-Golgi intermediate compartment protein 2
MLSVLSNRHRLSTGKRILGAFRKDMYQNDACRVYGQLEIHKCNGDFHITARGHGYQEVHGRGHLDHDSKSPLLIILMGEINFTHIIDELSFGEYFPNIVNPLDDTSQATTENLYRFQYFVSVVPTIYVADDFATKVIETNQYAVTDHRHPSAHHMGQEIPGIFFKYDVEPLQLTVLHGHISTYKFLMRLIALIGGVMACTEWVYKGVEGLTQFMERRKSGRKGSVAEGLLNGVIEKSN